MNPSQRSEDIFKSLVENSLVGVYLIQDGVFKYVNPKLAELFGYSQDELIEKKGPRNLTYPDDWPIVKENLRKRFEGEVEAINYTFRGQKKGGEVFDVEVFGTRVMYKERPAVVGTLMDITERKLHLEELQRQEVKLKAVFNNSPDVMLIVTLGGEIKSANRTTFRTLGYFEDTLIGKPFSILLNPSISLGFDDLTKDVRMQKTVLESMGFLKADVSICPMDMTVNLVPWEEGMVVLVNLRDVTERVAAEKAVKRRDAILESVRFAAEEFLKAGSWERNINEILKRIGIADDVSRVYIFKRHLSEDGKILCSQLFEWVADGIEPQIDNAELQNLPIEEKGFSRWLSKMQEGEPVYGNIKDFPESEQELLNAQEIKSILAMPIFVDNELWGFIGFDECRYEREWSPIEIDALRAAADIIGVAIYRGKMEKSLKEKLNELERFRKATIQREFRIRELQNRVKELEIEVERLRGGRYGT